MYHRSGHVSPSLGRPGPVRVPKTGSISLKGGSQFDFSLILGVTLILSFILSFETQFESNSEFEVEFDSQYDLITKLI